MVSFTLVDFLHFANYFVGFPKWRQKNIRVNVGHKQKVRIRFRCAMLAMCNERINSKTAQRCLYKVSRSVKFRLDLMMHSNKKIFTDTNGEWHENEWRKRKYCNPLFRVSKQYWWIGLQILFTGFTTVESAIVFRALSIRDTFV